MYLSDLTQVADFLNDRASGSIINTIYRSRKGTVLKLYGRDLKGIYFNLKEKVLFPVSDLSNFKKEPLTRLEEGLRSNISGRIRSVSVTPEYGKLLTIELFDSSLVIPLFRNRAVRIIDSSGTQRWIERNDMPLETLNIPMKHFDPLSDDPFFYETDFISEADKFEQIQKEQAIEKKRKKLISTLDMLNTQLVNYRSDIEKYSLHSAIIKQNLYSLNSSERKEFVELTDFNGNILKITLDASKTLLENMNRFFSKVKKTKSGVIHTEKRIAETTLAIEKLGDPGNFEHSENTDEYTLAPKKKKQNVHKPYHEFHASNGRIFLVGKEAKDNDELTFKISNPHDIWFHAKDYHGSHVIMKIKKGELPGNDDILTGCILAIFYSKAKKGMSGEVWYTARKNVTKKKGMAAGMVTFRNAKSKYINNAVMPEKLIKADG